MPIRIAHVTQYPNHRVHLYGIKSSMEATDKMIVPQKNNSTMVGIVIQTSKASHYRPNIIDTWSTNAVQAQFTARTSFLQSLSLAFLRKIATRSNPLTRANP